MWKYNCYNNIAINLEKSKCTRQSGEVEQVSEVLFLC